MDEQIEQMIREVSALMGLEFNAGYAFGRHSKFEIVGRRDGEIIALDIVFPDNKNQAANDEAREAFNKAYGKHRNGKRA